MRSGTQNEDAVSPTIATILLIAIAVVLVVIVTGVVMGAIGGEQEDTKFVEIYMVPSGENAFLLTVMGGYDADTLVSLNAYITGVTFEDNGFINNTQVGIPYLLKVSGSSTNGNALFTLVGTFEDGTVQMLYQRMVTVRGSGGVPIATPTVNPPTGDGSSWDDYKFETGIMIDWDTTVPGDNNKRPNTIYYDKKSGTYLCYFDSWGTIGNIPSPKPSLEEHATKPEYSSVVLLDLSKRLTSKDYDSSLKDKAAWGGNYPTLGSLYLSEDGGLYVAKQSLNDGDNNHSPPPGGYWLLIATLN
ncbi:archaellin/type IV pilin N-terminal domain-containing protein [Methanorbis furvi]|uniref:Archaeal Type IV pilin N-terminal domain-containing protein n=1 Tax=Methanorbis furvi TaxID=3028299 RepID=A0AAE4ME97_9EURY|nr:hypothetical protein [Methanocorpusculaceae archaeon Ag1]